MGGGFMQQLFWVNVSLVVFNMVPAFPMDGGRVLRALLAMRLDYVQATQIAASIGQAIALVFGLLGLFYNPFLIFIALFVWLAGTQEAGLVQIRSALGNIPVMRAMITDFRALHPDDPLERAVGACSGRLPAGFPGGRGRSAGRRAHAQRPRRCTRTVRPREPRRRGHAARLRDHRPARDAANRLRPAPGRPRRTLPVVQDGRLLGLLTADNVAEVLMIQEALREAHRPALFGGSRPTRDSWIGEGDATSRMDSGLPTGRTRE